MTNSFGIQVIAVRRIGDKGYHYIPRANEIFHEEDNFVAIGEISQLDRVAP